MGNRPVRYVKYIAMASRVMKKTIAIERLHILLGLSFVQECGFIALLQHSGTNVQGQQPLKMWMTEALKVVAVATAARWRKLISG